MSAKIRNLQARKAEQIKATRAFNDATDASASAENRAWTDAESADYAALLASVEQTNQAIVREQALALEEAGMVAAVPGRSHVEIPAAAQIGVTENVAADPNRGFQSLGDFARAVAGAGMASRTGRALDQRLAPLAAAPGSFAGEGNGADGGIIVPPGFSSSIFTLSLGEDALLPLTDQMNIDGNTMLIPKDETTPWGTNGIRAYWQGEAGAGTAVKPVFGGMNLRLHKLLALAPVSDEMVQDTSALNSYLPMKVATSIRWKANEAILFGAGNGTPVGALAGGAVVTVAKDGSQATNTLSSTNLANMISRLPPGSFGKSIWLINNSVLPALFTMNQGNYPVYLPLGAGVGGLQNSPYGTLLGRPVVVSQHAKAFSSQGDVLLVDLSYYQSITKAEGMQSATSMHLYFDADAMAFRTTFRMDGQPKISAPISPANGSVTMSPFVQLGAR